MRSRLIPIALAAVIAAAAILMTVPGRAAEDAAAVMQSELAQLGETYRTAFKAGDAEALSCCFTEDAEYVNAQGEVLRGREAIRSLAALRFAAEPGATLTSERRRFRVVNDGVVAIEGVATRHDQAGAIVSRAGYSILCVLGRDGWRIAEMRETALSRADALSPLERLESLSWLVGDWLEEADDARIKTTCRFADDGPYLIQTFTMWDTNCRKTTSTQRIAWDPLIGKFRSWSFDSLGGFGNAIWSETAGGWVIQSRAVSSDGVVRTGTHIITRNGEDIYRWEARARIVGDTLIDDQTFIIVRQPPEPR